ncbi:MAG: putative manganese-dependent inorganic diphosphatase [Sphaerochaetaceae bacterium]|jgi:manganese-dependent inorganic pyrophosphatase
MESIYITGHRNPDLDSVSSAWCYARLKNSVDSHNTYIPIRLGPLNETTKDLFHRLDVEPPELVKDVRPKVSDVMITDYRSLHPDDPVYNLIRLISDRRASVVPLLEGKTYVGLLSLDEITAFFLKENAGHRPLYQFFPSNFDSVVGGEFLKRNEIKSFSAHIMTGAMEYDIFCGALEKLTPSLPVLVVGNRRKHIEYAVKKQFPAIILTGVEPDEVIDVDFSSYDGIVYKSFHDTAETIRLLRMSLPVRHLLSNQPPLVYVDDLFEEAKKKLSDSEYRGLPVFDDASLFVGFVTRRCFLEKPRRQVIMVDHNELDQSVEGLEEADIVEIIDHHRLDAEKTQRPIFIASEPVGSTCTIVYHQYLRWGVAIDPLTAQMLVAGIIADTVMLKSPTTTNLDVLAVNTLAKIASITDIKLFGEQLFAVASTLSEKNAERIIEGDFKVYTELGLRFGIGQVEVTTLEQVDEVKEEYLNQLEAIKLRQGLSWAMLLVTDVIKEESILMTTRAPRYEKALIYPAYTEGAYLLKGVLSRKKQLLPEILRVLEEAL